MSLLWLFRFDSNLLVVYSRTKQNRKKKQNKNVLCYLFTLLTNEFVFLLSSSSFFRLVHQITETNRHSTNGGEAQSPPNVSGFRLFVTIYSNNKNLSLLRRLKEE